MSCAKMFCVSAILLFTLLQFDVARCTESNDSPAQNRLLITSSPSATATTGCPPCSYKMCEKIHTSIPAWHVGGQTHGFMTPGGGGGGFASLPTPMPTLPIPPWLGPPAWGHSEIETIAPPPMFGHYYRPPYGGISGGKFGAITYMPGGAYATGFKYGAGTPGMYLPGMSGYPPYYAGGKTITKVGYPGWMESSYPGFSKAWNYQSQPSISVKSMPSFRNYQNEPAAELENGHPEPDFQNRFMSNDNEQMVNEEIAASRIKGGSMKQVDVQDHNEFHFN